MENCLLLPQQVAHTSSGLSFEKADCEGIPRLGCCHSRLGALPTGEEAGESLKPQAGGSLNSVEALRAQEAAWPSWVGEEGQRGGRLSAPKLLPGKPAGAWE